eukprot:m.84268 g.84268  ORF g.84268 m.84268 type:complete len:750 (-) comp15012_c0_seq1:222-2471(-)
MIRTSLRQALQSASQSGLILCGSVRVTRAAVRFQSSDAATNNVPSSPAPADSPLKRIRNLGVSAHIDSGKTTLTERILFYTGRINKMHEVKGKDEVGATMDSMDLEREKGITIQSAATYATWKDYNINIIDTPGHVDFTIEVERALRVLDGAILVLCSVGGVQSQTLTVNRQMRRYHVPCIAFINKLDRPGADPLRVIGQIRKKLRHNAAALQIPMGEEDRFKGVIDIIRRKAMFFHGVNGQDIEETDVPPEYAKLVESKRTEMIAALAEVDDQIAEKFLMEETPTESEIVAAVRRTTIARTFTPVLMGSALKNTGVQPLLDAVNAYLPSPDEVYYDAYSGKDQTTRIELKPVDATKPFVGLAFKIEQNKFGQLTYMRTYQGVLRRGDFVYNSRDDKRVKVPRLVRMHANQMVDVTEVAAGEICAIFGLDCNTGDTFCSERTGMTMERMFVPDPVISLSIKPESPKMLEAFSKAVARFQKQDPTFRVHTDDESKETIISGMGELHLEIYRELMLREYNCPTIVGKPRVAFRETITAPATFDYIHKKQSGGAGQYGRVIGEISVLEGEEANNVIFEDKSVGQNIPKNFIPSIEKGFLEACQKGPLTGNNLIGVRFTLLDGVAHAVDSNDMAFRMAAMGALRQAVSKANPVVMEPIMSVEVNAPDEYQGVIIGGINKRRGTVMDSENKDGYVTVQAQVPLNDMFGYSADLRSQTQGKGEFTMEYNRHEPTMPSLQQELMRNYEKERREKQS